MPDEPTNSIVIELDPGGPIELESLTESFSGLARFFERHYRQDDHTAPKLFVTRLENGSVIAEIVPYAVIFGGLVATMGGVNTVAEFARRLIAAIRAFADIPTVPVDQVPSTLVTAAPTSDDAIDIKEFLRPLAGKHGAKLGIRHARFEKRDGPREIIVEVTFDEAAINRATVNIDAALDDVGEVKGLSTSPSLPRGRPVSEVMLFFETASQKPAKTSGRTADRGIIPDVSDKALPLYFLQTLRHLKDQMIRGEVNPFKSAFVVDAMVQYLDDDPKAYIITDVREVIPLDDDEQP